MTGPKNQYLCDGVFNFFYDGEGNLTKKRRISDDRTFTFGYDHNNQLTHVEERLTDGGTLVQERPTTLQHRVDRDSREARKQREQIIMAEILAQTQDRHEQLRQWAERTGKSPAAW